MSAQPSLLELFESRASVGAIHESPVPTGRRRALNPFRKYFGPCVRHCNTVDIARLYWCHRCGAIGCQEWLLKHKD